MNTTNNNIANIKIIGVGGGGNNSVDSMIKSNVEGVEFIIANTDLQVLNRYPKEKTIHLGSSNNRGLGAGAKPEIGKISAENSKDLIKEKIINSDMVIVTAGMGGGTGTGAAPVIAKISKDLGILTIAIVTTPFTFEGPRREQNAREGIAELRKHVDSLIVVSNNKLMEQFGNIPLTDSFKFANTVLKQTVKTLTDIIAVPAYINLDFADVTTVMKDKGNAIIGIGKSTGKDRAVKAAKAAISSPILESSIYGAKDMIINITGGKNLSLNEAHIVTNTIKKEVGAECNIIFGVAVDNNMDDELLVSVIATGLSGEESPVLEEEKWQENHREMTQYFTKEIATEDSLESKSENFQKSHLYADTVEIEKTVLRSNEVNNEQHRFDEHGYDDKESYETKAFNLSDNEEHSFSDSFEFPTSWGEDFDDTNEETIKEDTKPFFKK